MATLMTPGVYIEEKNAFPNSAVVVETAIPAFIGYTDFASYNDKSLLLKPTKITSFAEYINYFGNGFKAKFNVNPADKTVSIKENQTFYLYNSIRLFYANGGGACYIVSVGTYGDKPEGLQVKLEDFTGSDNQPDPLELLLKEPEPTLIIIPDAIILGEQCYSTIYTRVLAHCATLQSRIAIFDLVNPITVENTDAIVSNFRQQIGINFLNYGAAYYPWLKTTIVGKDEVDFTNIYTDLSALLPEQHAQKAIAHFKALANPTDADKNNYNNILKAISPTYVFVLNTIRTYLNELPPSGAMAGIYTLVDNTRGVWEAPANVSVAATLAPSINLTNEEQQNLNVDVMSGKSINVICAFTGVGILVWGGRTLDGNSQDWRYINVRRTLIMIEQSIKLATRAYVFEPNDANTWITVKSMIENFLTTLWKQGALAGTAPDQAFSVQIGLGSTMTANDILDGKMLVTVKVAVVRPAEFIIITFQQQMQQS